MKTIHSINTNFEPETPVLTLQRKIVRLRMAAAAMIGASIVCGAGFAQAAEETKVQWEEPEIYSDMDGPLGGFDEDTFEAFKKRFSEDLKSLADRYLPPDYGLYVSVRDVDLAGEYEPWRGPDFDDVRIVKDIYPPRLKFEYAVTDGAGEKVKDGVAQLTNQTFLWEVNPVRQSDQFYHEMELLESWARRVLRSVGEDARSSS